MTQPPDYAAPAVDKALDVLEALADAAGGLSQLEIANAIERSPGQIFRVLMRLERRRYVYRDAQTGLYQLSMRLFDLAHRHEPLHALVTAATRPMRALADDIQQSCNLGVLDDESVRVVFQAETPADFGFKIRVGATFPLTTTTGMVLATFSPSVSHLVEERAATQIREIGYLAQADAKHSALTDLVFPILRSDTRDAVATLTVPLVDSTFNSVPFDVILGRTARTVAEITEGLGV